MDNMEREMSLAEEYNQQGRVLYSMDKYEDAIGFYLKAESADPMYLQTYFNLTESYVMLDRFDDAKKALKRAQLLNKENGEIFFHLGNIALLEENVEEGKQHYAKAISLGYANPYIYMNLGSAYEDIGDLTSAVVSYNKAIQMDKYFASAWLKKLELYVNQEQYSEALSISDSMIELLPDKFEGYHYKFAILMEMGNKADAKIVLDKALELFPDDPGFKLDMVHYLEDAKKFEEAERLLDDSFFETQGSTDYARLKVQLLLKQEKLNEAADIAEKTLADTFDEELNFLLTNIYFSLEKYEAAIITTKRTIDEKSYGAYYFTALYFNALATKKSGKDATNLFNAAIKEFRMACSKNPGMVDLYIYRALCYREVKDYDRAYEMVDYILAISEDAPEALLIRSEINKNLGKMSEYEADRNEALKRNPKLVNVIM